MDALAQALTPYLWVIAATIAATNRVKSMTSWPALTYTIVAVVFAELLGLAAAFVVGSVVTSQLLVVLAIVGLSAAGIFDIADIIGGGTIAKTAKKK